MAMDSGFDQTQVLPTNWGVVNAGYVKHTDEWITRCLERVMALDVLIKRPEAHSFVVELAARERWRILSPETAANQLYEKPGSSDGR